MNICTLCMKEIKSRTFATYILENPICNKCLKELNPRFEKIKINEIEGEAIYEYNDFIKTTLYRFKGLYDIVLAPIFIKRFAFYLKLRYRGYIILPAPSFLESDKERGFNHVVDIFKILNMPVLRAFYKKTSYKQSSLPSKEREKVKDKIGIKIDLNLKGKKVLLVDDLLTTGSTIKTLIKLIKPYEPKSIKVLVMAHTTLKNN